MKRMTFTLSPEAESILQELPSGQRSKWVDWAVRLMSWQTDEALKGKAAKWVLESNELARNRRLSGKD